MIAKLLARPRVVDWLIRRAERTPYSHLSIWRGKVYVVPPAEAYSIEHMRRAHWYMRRFWLLRLGPLQVRLHNILAEDPDRAFHDHPWPFRSFILRGWYLEERDHGPGRFQIREAGDTYRMGRGDYHRIVQVADGGVWTLFVTWGARSGWGFKMPDGSTVPHEDY